MDTGRELSQVIDHYISIYTSHMECVFLFLHIEVSSLHNCMYNINTYC